MKARTKGLVMAGLMLALGACGGGSTPEPAVPAPPAPIRISVLNTTGELVTVGVAWADASPTDRHSVAADAETAYELGWYDDSLRFVVEIGRATVTTNVITPRPGDRLRITVSPPQRVVVDRIGGGA